MLVYGDAIRTESVATKLEVLFGALRRIRDLAGGVLRHAEIVGLLIEAGELAQGLADFEFRQKRADERSPATDLWTMLTIELARSVARSWESEFQRLPLPDAGILHAARELLLPDAIQVNRPEGYAFYALYPEAYIEAARPLASEPLKIVGLRSIGTSLGAAVAAGAGKEDALTLRPVGHPFDRKLALSESMSRELTISRDAFAVVDEGPGLSGSSFNCVADFLERRGATPDRVHFFPSHSGELGPEASTPHRTRWANASRHFVSFERLILEAKRPAHRLDAWCADLVGVVRERPIDLSGGLWRAYQGRLEAEWPPSNRWQERRKYLLRSETGSWLAKFAGLGSYGCEKLDLAGALAGAGFTPPLAGLRHGFLVERWLDDARANRPHDLERSRFLEHVAAYVAFRGKRCPADRPGASIEQLSAMARRNTELGLGPELARLLAADEPRSTDLARYVRHVRTDNRMHAWEWLAVGDGWIKADALDHHAAHDLVGCQDVAWDVAGLAIEFDLSAHEIERLGTLVEQEVGRPVPPELIGFYLTSYLAFQLGYYSTAAAAASGEEVLRLRAAADRYSQMLRRRLQSRQPRCVSRRSSDPAHRRPPCA